MGELSPVIEGGTKFREGKKVISACLLNHYLNFQIP